MPDTKPTRSELIALTKKVKLAKSGHKLLKRKRDGLIQELFKIMEKARKQKTRLNERYSDAQDSMDRARAIEGTSFMKSVSFAVFQKPRIVLVRFLKVQVWRQIRKEIFILPIFTTIEY